MKQELCVLPVKCVGCQRTFDLWRVLQEQESRIEENTIGVSRVLKQNLCPGCRKLLERDQRRPGEQDDSATQEYEIMLDFE